MARREFLATIAMVGAGLAKATTASVADKRVFLAGFSHETNTFHPVPTTTFRHAPSGEFRLELTFTRRPKPVFPFEPETPFDPEAAPVL